MKWNWENWNDWNALATLYLLTISHIVVITITCTYTHKNMNVSDETLNKYQTLLITFIEIPKIPLNSTYANSVIQSWHWTPLWMIVGSIHYLYAHTIFYELSKLYIRTFRSNYILLSDKGTTPLDSYLVW